jgi:hypothetical protein
MESVLPVYKLVDGSNQEISLSNPLPVYLSGSTVFGQIKPTHYCYVGKNGNDSTGDGSAGNPYLTIGAAITASSSGTTIWIFPGTYTEDITFKAGVYLTSPALYSVYITGNHTANFTGTVVNENIILQSVASAASGTALTFSGTGAQNLQFYQCNIDSKSTSGAGDAINWTNTNSLSKIQIIDGSVSVATATSTARCFYSTTGAAGSVIANRTTFKLNTAGIDLVCLSIGGAVSFTHTSDTVTGQIAVSGTAVYIGALVALTTGTVAAFTTSSSGTSVFSSVPITTTASPAITGSGGFAFVAIEYLSTGVGGSATLNSGAGAIPLTMAPIRIRSSSLLPSASVAAGLLGGTLEYDGTHLYVTLGTARYTINVTAV